MRFIKPDIIVARSKRFKRLVVKLWAEVVNTITGNPGALSVTHYGTKNPTASLGNKGDRYSKLNQSFWIKFKKRGWTKVMDLTTNRAISMSSKTSMLPEYIVEVDRDVLISTNTYMNVSYNVDMSRDINLQSNTKMTILYSILEPYRTANLSSSTSMIVEYEVIT